MEVQIESLWRKGSEWSAVNVLISNTNFSEEPVKVRNFGFHIWGLHAIEFDQFDNLLLCDLGGE